MDYRITCPHCQTTYSAARCGIADVRGKTLATIGCPVCHQAFDVVIVEGKAVTTVEQPGWFARVVLRRKPVTTVEEMPPTVDTFVR